MKQKSIWIGLAASLFLAACGGGSSTGTNSGPATPIVSVSANPASITTAQSTTVFVDIVGSSGVGTGTVTLSSGTYNSGTVALTGGAAYITIPAGVLPIGTNTLTATFTSTSSTYTNASGTGFVAVTSTVITPVVTVSVGPTIITPSQSTTVTVAVDGGFGNPTPTGSITLTNGSLSLGTQTYNSGPQPLTNGSAQITVPASSLMNGSNMLTATYTPDANGSSAYRTSQGTASVLVSSLLTPTVTVSLYPPIILGTQSAKATVTVSGGNGNPTPTGSVTVTCGGYYSGPLKLFNGSSSASIPGYLGCGLNSVGTTVTAAYTPNSQSSGIYNPTSGVGSLTAVPSLPPTVTISANPSTFLITQSTTVTITVSGPPGQPTPLGTVDLSSGRYESKDVSLVNGSAQITIPAGALTAGNDTLVSVFSPNGCPPSPCSMYSGGSGTSTITVIGSTPTVTVSPSPASIIAANPPPGQSISYSCVGSLGPGGSDAQNITSLFASSGAGTQVNLSGQNCTANSTIVWGSQQSLNLGNSTLTCNLSAGPCTANTAYVAPTTKSFICALTPGSTSVNCPSANFSAANDVNESFYCPDALASTVDLHTSIALVNSGTSITLTDPTGSTIAAGNFACQETIRNQGWGLFANGGSIVNANAGGSGLYLQELILKSCNNCAVTGVDFVNPAGGSNWHTMIADVSNFTADGNTIISGLGFGQDGLHIIGPYQDVEVVNTTLDTGDDGIALDGGEYIGSGTILNTNGAGHGASIDNTQGSDGSRCIAIYSLCANASGSCVANLQSDIYIEGVTGLPGTHDGTQGCIQAVGISVPNTASPEIDNVWIRNVSNNFNPQSASTNRPYVYVSPSSGIGSGAGLIGNLSIEIPGNIPTTDATGNDAAVTLDGLNQDLTVQNLTVVAPNFTGPGLLLSEINSSGTYTVGNYYSDNFPGVLYGWVTPPVMSTLLSDLAIGQAACPVWTSGAGLLTGSTAAQSTTVAVTVSGGAGSITPTGSVSLSSGSVVLGSATLTSGSAQITVQANALSIGSNTLTANYTPDTNGSLTYGSGSGTASVAVSTASALITPAVTVSPNPSSIASTGSTTLTVTVSGGAANPTPTGSVTLACGSTTLGAATLSGGSAQFTVPASSLFIGPNTLTFVYTVDARSFGTYNNASGTASATVN